MNDSTSPFFVALLFILRCLVPLAVLFGISYLLRKWGLVAVEATEEPVEVQENNGQSSSKTDKPAEAHLPGEKSNEENITEEPRSHSQ